MAAGFPLCHIPVLQDRAVGWGGTRGSRPTAAPLLQGFPKQNGVWWGNGHCGMPGGPGTLGPCPGEKVSPSHALGSPGIPQCILANPAQICDPKFPH